eukprot:2905324-Rhodomonas_salina.1
MSITRTSHRQRRCVTLTRGDQHDIHEPDTLPDLLIPNVDRLVVRESLVVADRDARLVVDVDR